MSSRNDFTGELAETSARQSCWRTFGDSSSLLRNSTPTNCDSRWPFSSSRESSSTESGHERRKDRSISRDRQDGPEEEARRRRRRRSQSPSFSSSSSSNNRTVFLSPNMDLQKTAGDNFTQEHHWDSLHINIGNKKGSFSSSKSFSSQNSLSYKQFKSRSQECSSRSSYYDSGNENKSSNFYQSQVDELIPENHSSPKSSKQRRDNSKKSNSRTRKKDLQLLEKLLRVKDPDLERELKNLAKEKLGKHLKGKWHKERQFSSSDYEQREPSFNHESEDRVPMWKSQRPSSPPLYSKSDSDWYRNSGSTSSIKGLKSCLKNNNASSILRGEIDDGDTFLHGKNKISGAKSHERLQKEFSSSHKSKRSPLLDDSDSETNVTDSTNSKPDMWDTIHEMLNEQKHKRFCDKSSQNQDSAIKNILKSIGFDVEMSNRMHERAEQVSNKSESLKTDKSSSSISQYGLQGMPNMSTEMDKGLLERTQMQIFTIEKSLPCKDQLTGVPTIDTSVPPPHTNFPGFLLPPPPLFNRQPPNTVLPTQPPPLLPPSLSARYGQITPAPHAGISPCVTYLPQQQPPFGAANLYANVQPQQFDYDSYQQRLYYDNAASLASPSVQPPSVPPNLNTTPLFTPKSNLPEPCTTTLASLPGFSQRDGRSPHSFKRHHSPKAAKWSPEREWSPRINQSPPHPQRRHRSPSLSPKRHRSPSLSPRRHRSSSLSPRRHRSPSLSPRRHRSPSLSSRRHRSPSLSSRRHRSPSLSSRRHRSPSLSSRRHRSPSLSPRRHRSPLLSPRKHRSPSLSPRKHRSPSLSPRRHRSPSLSPRRHQRPSLSPRRNRSPLLHPRRDRSPALHPSRDRSPALHPSRDRSPALHPSRDRSPALHLNRERPPPLHPNRERPPPLHPNRERPPPLHPNRDRSPLSLKRNYVPSSRSERSRDRSPDTVKERLKCNSSSLHHSHLSLSQRLRSPPYLDRERTPPIYDRSPPTLHRHSFSPTRFDLPHRDQSWTLKLPDTKSCTGSSLDKSGSGSGDFVKTADSLSAPEIQQMKKLCMEHLGKVETLQKELRVLQKQQNELMRKKQRVKDGHKDPGLLENAALQDEVNSQISLLMKIVKEFSKTIESSGFKPELFSGNNESKHSKTPFAEHPTSMTQNDDYLEKKMSNNLPMDSLDKSPCSLRCELPSDNHLLSKGDPPFPLKRKLSLDKSQKLDNELMLPDGKNSSDKKMPPFPLRKSAFLQESFSDGSKMSASKDDETKNSEDQNGTQKVNFEYFDPGNHWCRLCNLAIGNIYELFQHLQSTKHRVKMDPDDRPWLPDSIRNPSNKPKYGQVQMAPIKGVEFLMATTAFYCTLCKEFSGDILNAEAHLKDDCHNIAYQKHIEENPNYEKRLNLDKAAGLQSFTFERDEETRNTDDSDHDEENHTSSKSSQRKIKTKTTKENSSSDASSRKESNVMVKVEKEENALKYPESVEECQGKDLEIVASQNLHNEDSTRSLQERPVDQSSQGVQKSKIAIKLTGKSGIRKPVQYPVVPPWIPVGKMPGRGKGSTFKSGIRKKFASKQMERPLPLGAFLTSSNEGSIPVISEAAANNVEMKEPHQDESVRKDDASDVPVVEYGPHIATKDGKEKTSFEVDRPPLPALPPPPVLSNPTPLQAPEELKEEPILLPVLPPPPPPPPPPRPYYTWAQEDLNDMKLLGIDPASQIPLAEIRPPPLPLLLRQQKNKMGLKIGDAKSGRDGKSCLTDLSTPNKIKNKDLSSEKTSALLSQPKTSPKKNKENGCSHTEIKESQESVKADLSLLKMEEEKSSSKSHEQRANDSVKADSTNETSTEMVSKAPHVEKESKLIQIKDNAILQPEVKSIEVKEKKGIPISIAKSVSACASLSGIADVSSLKLQPTISLVPLPASLDMVLSGEREVPLASRPDVLIRESEHNYALRLMENSEHVRPRRSHIHLHDNNEEEDDDDDDNDPPNWKARTLKVKRTALNRKSEDEDDKSGPNSSSDGDSDSDSTSHHPARCLDSDDSTSPPLLTHEQERNNLIAKHDSPPSLSAESPCLTRNVALSCPSAVLPVTLICSSKADSGALYPTPEPLCIDSSPILENSLSILNFDSVVRHRAAKNTTRGQSAKKQVAGNKSSGRGSKKAASMRKKTLLEGKADAPSRKANQPELNLISANKIEQEKIIVKVTSHTSEGVPVISLTAASPNVTNSCEPSTFPIATTAAAASASSSSSTTYTETETGDTSLVEAAAKKAETLPKMFMPTVVLHDIKYTMGRDLSQMTAIPASIENIPIFESENESDTDTKSDVLKKSGYNSRSLEIESPSKSTEAFDPYIFLNRPTRPSVPSTNSCTNQTSSIIDCSSSHLGGCDSSSLTSIVAGGTTSSGQVTADSLPSLDHRSMVSSMFDVTDSKYAFPEVFLENGEPETSMKLSTVDVLGPELPFESSGKSSISIGLNHLLTDF